MSIHMEKERYLNSGGLMATLLLREGRKEKNSTFIKKTLEKAIVIFEKLANRKPPQL